MANSWQQPVDAEPGGGQWHKFEDPSTEWVASETAWAAGVDDFANGIEVDFSSIKRTGMKAVRCAFICATASVSMFYRVSGDTNISNTPYASAEWSHRIGDAIGAYPPMALWLSTDYKVQFTAHVNTIDFYLAYPIEYML